MDRSEFLKGVLALTGTAFVYGCKDVADELSGSYSSPVSKDAQDWFSNNYVKVFEGARTQGVSVTRSLDWAKQKVVKSSKHDFIWVPIEYAGNEKGTAILMWKEGEEYVQKLAQYLSWSIAEGFLIYRKPNGDYDGFLAQIAFDPLKNKPGSTIDASKFTGLVINADWNEKILRSWRFLDGKLVNYYNPDAKNKGGRTQECITYYTQYSTASGVPCGPSCIDVTYTLHSIPNTYCYGDYNSSDQGGYTGSGGYSGNGQSGGGYSPPTTPSYSPFVYYPINDLINNATSAARNEFMSRLNNSLYATGMATSVLDFSLSKATAITQSLGLEAQTIKIATDMSTKVPITGIQAVTGLGVFMSSVTFAIGIADNGWQWEQDGVNALVLTLGVVGLAAGGWVAVVAGGISIAIAVYTHP